MDEIELCNNLNINRNLTECDIDNFYVTSRLEQQIQNQETKDSGWRFDKISSMTLFFYITTELNGSSYVKNPMKSSALLNIEIDVKYCFLWSILAHLHPCENSHPNRVSNYKQNFDELNIQEFDFSNGFEYSDVYKFEKLNNLSINIFEFNFQLNGNERKYKLIRMEISKNDSDKVIDLLIYKNRYALIKNFSLFLVELDSKFVCRQCLSSYSSRNVLIKQKQRCEQQEITAIKTSNESHLFWKKHFHKNPFYFRIYAEFEA